jgi:hypothetical protein
MKGPPLRALVAVVLAGVAAFAAVRAKERRRALTAGPLSSDPPDNAFAESNMGEVATGEGMPEVG